MELIIVRHGQTEWSQSGQHTGVTEIELTDHGRAEAVDLRPLLQRLLAGREPVVVSSPRQRAQQTADLALPGSDVTVDARLAEYDYGDYEGLTFAQIRARNPTWDIWRDGCPGGESTPRVAARADAFLRERVQPAGDTPVVAVTHGHFSRILAARALGRPGVDASIFDTSTGSMSVIKGYRGQPLVSLWNLTAADVG